MEVLVLNGSPKGDASITMQYIAFLQSQFPGHIFTILNIAQRSPALEADPAAFAAAIDRVRGADAVLWAFPLYFMLVAAQYKRFIELVDERGAGDAFRGKYTAALTTSIRFFDHTAHNYIQAVADDWGMNFVGGYSAEMHDLFKPAERDRLTAFTAAFLAAVADRAPTARVHPPLTPVAPYRPGPPPVPIDTGGKKILIISDAGPGDASLTAMLDRFRAAFTAPVELVNLRHLAIAGGCLGCLRCGFDNTCVYTGKDDYIAFYEGKVKTADIIVFAGAIRDRYLSARWKTYFDRTFYNNHVPTLRGKQLACIISGPLGQLANLRQILEAYTQLQQANLAGIVTDEADHAATDSLLTRLAATVVDAAASGYIQPPSFLCVGGRKLFRDEVWGRMRFPFVADHKYYLANDLYDFPHRDWGSRLQSGLLYWAAHIPALRRRLYSDQMIANMLAPFQKLRGRLARAGGPP